jgi:hypothetical protein
MLPLRSLVGPHGKLASSLLAERAPVGLPRGETCLTVTPDGRYKLELLGGVKVAFNPAVTLLDRAQITALLQVVNVFLRHA